MNVSRIGKKLMRLALLAMLLCTPAGTAMAAPVTGAIFTTDENSNFVNANIYETSMAARVPMLPAPRQGCRTETIIFRSRILQENRCFRMTLSILPTTHS